MRISDWSSDVCSSDLETGQPLLKPEVDCGGDRAVDDGEPARCAAEQDRRPEAPVEGSLEAFEMLSGAERDRSHAISAPPPKLKKLRKKLDAANAIDRPNTIWIRRRKPPLLSPNAKVRPVTMMTITATIFATGPWTDSSTCCSGDRKGTRLNSRLNSSH